MLSTAQANGLEPYHYLHKVFTEIPSCLEAGHPIDDLLPWNIKREIQPKTTPSRGVNLAFTIGE